MRLASRCGGLALLLDRKITEAKKDSFSAPPDVSKWGETSPDGMTAELGRDDDDLFRFPCRTCAAENDFRVDGRRWRWRRSNRGVPNRVLHFQHP